MLSRIPSTADAGYVREILTSSALSRYTRLGPFVYAAPMRDAHSELPSVMPDPQLTVADACRLWHVDAAKCQVILEVLVAEGYLARTSDGVYVARQATPHDTERSTRSA